MDAATSSIGVLSGLPGLALTNLPDLALTEIFGSLCGKDLFNLCRASPMLIPHVVPFVARALSDDGLPGETVSDLVCNYAKLETYQEEVLRGLYEVAPGASTSDMVMGSDEGMAAVREFLKTAINNFTGRVSGAHSWYKHLPVGISQRFDFCFNPMVNMRVDHKTGSWEKKVRGDGSEFHYTWLPTDDYRSQYGFFDYRLPREVQNTMVLCDANGIHFHVPRSARGPEVDVTAAIHYRSVAYDLYQPILDEAIRRRQPNLVYEELSEDMFNHMQSRFRNCTGMRLPEAAAADLERAVEAFLAHQKAVASQDPPPTSDMARKAVSAQRKREQQAVALSLRELCLRNFGNDLTPSVEDILSMSFKQFR